MKQWNELTADQKLNVRKWLATDEGQEIVNAFKAQPQCVCCFETDNSKGVERMRNEQNKIDEFDKTIRESEGKIDHALAEFERQCQESDEDGKKEAHITCNLILQREWVRIERTRSLQDRWMVELQSSKPHCVCCPETTNLTECQAIPGSTYLLCPRCLRDEEDQS